MLSWQSRLVAYLNQRIRYPWTSRIHGENGVVRLRFTIDRDGRVLVSSLEKSSGYARLDNAGLALLQQASPLPKPPRSVSWQSSELIVPVRYSLD